MQSNSSEIKMSSLFDRHPTYTNIVEKSDSIIEVFENGYKKIIAVKMIKTGELLLLEHVLVGPAYYCMNVVAGNELLFDSLYPRTIGTWDDLYFHQEARQEESRIKVPSNCFNNGENITIGLFISSLNHSCFPNSIVSLADRVDHLFIKKGIMVKSLFAVKNITIGEEITITYKAQAGHSQEFEQYHNFQCLCGRSDNEREKIINILTKIADTFVENNKRLIEKKVDQYLKSRKGMDTLILQYIASEGFYFGNQDSFFYAERFLEKISPNQLIEYVNMMQEVFNSL